MRGSTPSSRSSRTSWGISPRSTAASNDRSREYHTILQALRRIEPLLVDERGRREILERSLEELKRQVVALQARIQELEERIRG